MSKCFQPIMSKCFQPIRCLRMRLLFVMISWLCVFNQSDVAAVVCYL